MAGQLILHHDNVPAYIALSVSCPRWTTLLTWAGSLWFILIFSSYPYSTRSSKGQILKTWTKLRRQWRQTIWKFQKNLSGACKAWQISFLKHALELFWHISYCLWLLWLISFVMVTQSYYLVLNYCIMAVGFILNNRFSFSWGGFCISLASGGILNSPEASLYRGKKNNKRKKNGMSVEALTFHRQREQTNLYK